MALQSVKENPDRVCTYMVTICTPLLCHVEHEHEGSSISTKIPSRSKPLRPNIIEQMTVMDVVEAQFLQAAPNRKPCIHYGTGGW